MQTAVHTYRYLKFVPFQNFNLWDVKRYYSKATMNFKNVISLSDLLVPYRKPVSKEEMIEHKWQIISKINFGGELFLRDFDEINTYKGNLNLVPDNAIIYSKINVRHGCIYYHDKEKIPFGVSSEYPTYTFDETKVNGKFLHKLLRSEAFKKLLNTKTTGISKARVKQDEFLNTQIPLPSLKEQETLVNNYFNKIAAAEKLSKQANDLESEIEAYFLEQLGVEKTETKIRKSVLNFVSFENIEKWGVEYNLGAKSNYFLNSSKFKLNKLKTLIDINPSTILPKNDLEISFIPMECISDERGEVIELRNKKISEAKGYTKFKEGDLIWARITPCMQNGKSAIVNNLANGLGVGSTEFHVLRNSRNDVNIKFIHTLLRLDIVLKNAMSHFTGSAGQQRVPKSFLEELEVPLPPLPKQQEIVNHIQELKEKIKESNSQATQLKSQAEQAFEQAIFKD